LKKKHDVEKMHDVLLEILILLLQKKKN
jgi:hypothetical protein